MTEVQNLGDDVQDPSAESQAAPELTPAQRIIAEAAAAAKAHAAAANPAAPPARAAERTDEAADPAVAAAPESEVAESATDATASATDVTESSTTVAETLATELDAAAEESVAAGHLDVVARDSGATAQGAGLAGPDPAQADETGAAASARPESGPEQPGSEESALDSGAVELGSGSTDGTDPASDMVAEYPHDEIAAPLLDDASDARARTGAEIAEAVSEVTDGADAGAESAAEGGEAGGAALDSGEFEDEEELSEGEFRAALEAMLLVVDAPAPVELLASALRDHPIRVETALREMSAELTARRSGMDLRFVGEGWRYYTRTEFAPYVERMLLDGARSKLTRAALETMAVIAYRQPVTRARVSAVRGVNVDGVIRTLLARGLIAEAGADPETNGTLYITTELFLERIGLASLADLPPLAPLLPGVDLIDEINESLDTDPRYTRLKKPAEADIDLGTDD